MNIVFCQCQSFPLISRVRAEDIPKTVGSLCATGDDQHYFVAFNDGYLLDCREVSGHRKISLNQDAPQVRLTLE